MRVASCEEARKRRIVISSNEVVFQLSFCNTTDVIVDR